MQAAYNYLRADCKTVLLDIIERYSIIIKVNLKARGFTEFTRYPYRCITIDCLIHPMYLEKRKP